jgi:dienelactone hydrolase
VNPGAAPYPTLVFAAGFLSASINYTGNGEHLASWGYIVAVPHFLLEMADVRASDVRCALTYLEAENARPGSRFYHKIDTHRFGLAGHSLGGVATMMAAAEDGRVKAAVALDPATGPSSTGYAWDYAPQVSRITAPLVVIGAPIDTSRLFACNANPNYHNVYPLVGSQHKAKVVLADGSHCDFMDTDDSLARMGCYFVCGGDFDSARVQLVERYTTAWFNYYLKAEPDHFLYLYGGKADEDIRAARFTRDFHTAPRDLAADSQPGAVDLSWTVTDYPIIAGYNIYRTEQSGSYPGTPYLQLGLVASHTDTAVVPGRRYFYRLCSRDAAGNEHQPSGEVNTVAGGAPAADAHPDGRQGRASPA